MTNGTSKSALPEAVEELVTHLRQQEREVADTKRVVNSLLRRMGEDPMFSELDEPARTVAGRPKVKLGQFFSKPTATAITEYLEMVGEPVAFAELMEALDRGGFRFAGKYPKRSLKISIGKNTKFVLIGGVDDAVGMRSWFPNLKSGKDTVAFNETNRGAAPTDEESTPRVSVANDADE